MKITILAQSADNIKASLDSLLPGNVITAFNSVTEMSDFTLNSTHKTDVLVIEDNGVAVDASRLSENFMKLATIFDYRFFRTKRVIFLNKPDNLAWLNYYNYLQEELEDRDIEVNISTKLHTVTDVKNMVLELNKVFTKIKTNDLVVIQKARKENIENEKVIPETDNDLGISVELPQFNREKAKAPFRRNTTELNIGSDKTKVPSIIVEEDFTVEKEEVHNDKFIMVTGVENSGVSTTSFIMAKSATHDDKKVLLIDIDIHNMGLSYLADKVYGKIDNVHTINLEDIYTKTFDSVILQTMNKDSLHIAIITLKLIQKVEDIEFTVINLIERVKDRYDYIIFDAPLRICKYYPTLLGTYVDRIIMTNIPYLNKTVSALKQISQSSIIHLRAFREKKISAFSVGLLDKNGLKSVSRNVCKKYSTAILGLEIPYSGTYLLQKEGYDHPAFFHELINANAIAKDTDTQEGVRDSMQKKTQQLYEESKKIVTDSFGNKDDKKSQPDVIEVSEVFRKYRKNTLRR